jgi:cystathionine beta-lyase/cystathionine gamma-synthase
METETLACHAGREDFARLEVHAPPIDFSSTYPIPDLDEAARGFEAFAQGECPSGANPIYARLHNPTVRRFELALAELEGTEDAVAFASGMATLTATLLAACEGKRHVIALRPLYGGSDHLLACSLLGLEVTWARDAFDVAAALRSDTGLVILETPQNPTLGVVDISAVVAAARGVPVLVDNTFATPILQNPAAHGAEYVLHSATKFLGGHGDVIAGVVATSDERARGLRQVRILTGAVLHPMAAYLLHRSLPTLPLRVHAAQRTASVLARRLATDGLVERVLYPEADGVQLRGPGAVLSFEISGGLETAARVMSAVRLVTPAVSLGSTDTLIQHPAALTHRLVDPAAKAELGITDGLLRLSVGLEDAEDLWTDLTHALAAARVRAAA